MFSRRICAVVGAVLVLALLPGGAGAAPVDLTAPLECGPFGTGAPATAARIPAGSPLTSEPNVEEAYERALALGERPLTRRAAAAARATGPVRIPVFVHVIHAGGVGNVADSVIDAQIAVLNDSFNGGSPGGAPSPFVFERAGITRTDNATWHEMGTASFADERAAKAALRRGGARTLNLYLVNADPYLGWATFPDQYATDPIDDGVVVDYRTVPGGAFTNYAQGETATHEVGHWLGLFHTFEGGCIGPGDLVADTEPELIQTNGCPPSKETCPGGGPDPIHNYMDYSYDVCMFEFTAGQVERMDAQTAQYRNTPPDATPAALRVRPGGKEDVILAAPDAEGDPVSFAITDPPDHGKLTGGAATRVYTADGNFSGKDTFTFSATDTLGGSRSATVSIVVDGRVRVDVNARKQQRLSKLAVKADCGNESCRLRAGGKVVVSSAAGKASHTFKLRKTSGRAAAGKSAKLRLRVKGASKLRQLLEDGARAIARVSVSGTDAVGNKDASRVRITVKP